MANRLRSSSGRISFFAFQDMITTVTGVLLLITLLLTFYLNEPAAPAQSTPAPSAAEVERARQELQQSVAALQQEQHRMAALTNKIFVLPEPDRLGKTPVLIVLSATNGWCDVSGQSTPVEFEQRADNADFRRLLDSWNPARQRLVFYIRPSGIAHFETCRQLAQQRSFNIGYDAAEENRQYVLATP